MPTTSTYRVTFVLPHFTNVPIGGYKVVYEFANELVKRGHQVNVVLPLLMAPSGGIVSEIKNALRPIKHKLVPSKIITWFDLDPRVNVICCADLREKWLPEADFILATSWRTAPFVAGYSARLGRKLYLIQHLEVFGGPYEDVVATWKLPLEKLVIAKWLADFADSIGESSHAIRLGVDFDHFGLDRPIENRGPKAVMLYHDNYVKASWDGIYALELAREQIPDLSVVLFGTPIRPGELPRWIDYVHCATPSQLRSIYNQASILVHPSWAEGWPMPPAEAMTCGAAVVASANPGILDYLRPGETGITYRPRYWTELADAIVAILKDEKRRVEVAEAGHKDILQYTWTHATDRFLEVLGDCANR